MDELAGLLGVKDVELLQAQQELTLRREEIAREVEQEHQKQRIADQLEIERLQEEGGGAAGGGGSGSKGPGTGAFPDYNP